eukprot:CAMPEP_0194283140 /NCGR_PEP_ID=MMETSP0169-20130528/24752_1 /TAXON_ID=218684 /ORGANISM="Corethron pennatum, Strain L29A3" /LENGTH=53 /DNA_ID=CAMNT_0039028677 /DNA_START=108 /DNA_END=265 /DNA_ORIENTATION=+
MARKGKKGKKQGAPPSFCPPPEPPSPDPAHPGPSSVVSSYGSCASVNDGPDCG